MSDRSTGNSMIGMAKCVDFQMNGSNTYYHDPNVSMVCFHGSYPVRGSE